MSCRVLFEKRVSTALSQEAAVGVKWKDMTKAMAAYGVRQTDIATVLGVSVPTMYRHLRYELDAGATLSNSKVAESMYQMATEHRMPLASRPLDGGLHAGQIGARCNRSRSTARFPKCRARRSQPDCKSSLMPNKA
jgi:hypothetical protein